jgi:hypothetical protein
MILSSNQCNNNNNHDRIPNPSSTLIVDDEIDILSVVM